MLNYYFFYNTKRSWQISTPYIYLLAIAFELNTLVLNMAYLNKFFLNMGNAGLLKNKKLAFNSNIFFFKIRFLSRIFKNFFKINNKIQSWKSLIMIFFISLNSIVVKTSFLEFNLNISLGLFNIKNYYYRGIYTIFKISSRPGRLSIYYFLLYVYRIFLVTRCSMFIPKSLILLNIELVLFFKLVKVRDHVNHRFNNLIYV